MWTSIPRFRNAIAGATILPLAFILQPSTGAQQVRNLTNLPYEAFYGEAVLDDAGSVAYSVSSTNQFGTNPSRTPQIMKWDLVTGTGSLVTEFAQGVESVSVSDDGQWLAFVSCSNPLGLNHDGSTELFVMRSDGTALVQLTDHTVEGPYQATISGSGNKIVFVDDADLLGTNPDDRDQLFVIDRDGTGLTQLTHATTNTQNRFSISDDGERVAFDHTGNLTGSNPAGVSQVFAVQSNGANLRQLTAFPEFGGYGYGSVVSGNGAKVAFGGYSPSTGNRILTIDWNGSGLLDLASGDAPSITDDGQTIVYTNASQIWKMAADGTGNTQLTSGVVPQNTSPTISGDGSRIVFSSRAGEYPGGNNPDGGAELIAMAASGSNVRQLTVDSADGYGYAPEITPDGTRIFFLSSGNVLGTNPDLSTEVFRVLSDGTDFAQVTNFAGDRGVTEVSASADGSYLVFGTYATDACERDIFKIRTDGTGLLLLAGGDCTTGASLLPVTSGGWVIFQSIRSIGTNPDGSAELFRVRTTGASLAPITQDDDNYYKDPRLSETNPVWIVYHSASNKDGLNPDGSVEIFRIKHDGTGLQRLTADPVYWSSDPDISGDANRIVYDSAADPLGTNPEHNTEIFLYDVPSATRRQLTSTPTGDSIVPRISKDGAWVYFTSDAPFFEPGSEAREPYRVSVATGIVERAGGTRCRNATMYEGSFRYPNSIAVDGTGTRAAFPGSGDWDCLNPDRGHDVYLVDQAGPRSFQIGKATPTVVTFTPEPKPKRYDVIRGNVASLSVAAGSTVDLGPVLCLEDDSPDSDTLGNEDAIQPTQGQVLFYLYRGSQGVNDGPGSWGQGSGGRERVAGVGACQP